MVMENKVSAVVKSFYNVENINKIIQDNIDEDKIENTGLFMYLIHEQLKNIAQKNKEQEKQ